jgi:hypothetical protein
MSSKDAQTKGRLRARPTQVTGTAPVGLPPLMLGAARDSYLYVPATTGRLDPPRWCSCCTVQEATRDKGWTCFGVSQTRPG